jgi:hypothetical protein
VEGKKYFYEPYFQSSIFHKPVNLKLDIFVAFWFVTPLNWGEGDVSEEHIASMFTFEE